MHGFQKCLASTIPSQSCSPLNATSGACLKLQHCLKCYVLRGVM